MGIRIVCSPFKVIDVLGLLRFSFGKGVSGPARHIVRGFGLVDSAVPDGLRVFDAVDLLASEVSVMLPDLYVGVILLLLRLLMNLAKSLASELRSCEGVLRSWMRGEVPDGREVVHIHMDHCLSS
jgi:hypothetical protein